MTINNKQLIKASSIICIAACICDFLILFILGTLFPGYSQLKNTISALGASISPMSGIISVWWIIIGFLFILFGIGFSQAFSEYGKNAKLASWFIILYGLGEGIGSGAFKADHLADTVAITLIIHDTLGAFGVAAIIILPLMMKRIISKTDMPLFHILSNQMFITSIILLILFTFRYSENESNILKIYQGLWQRLMMLNNYIYFSVLAYLMYQKANGKLFQLKRV